MAVQFQSTIWTQIKKAKEKDTDSLNNFILRYQNPIKMYLLEKGVKAEDADDITQDVFTTIFENRVLERAEQKKGRLRSLLLAVTNNMLRHFHRKKESDSQLIKEILKSDLVYTDETSEEFDNFWVKNIIDIALEKLRTESEQTKTPYYETIRSYILQDMDYESIARELSVTLQQVKNYIHRGRSRLISYMKEEVKLYSSSKEEYEDELNCILRYL